MFFENSNFQPSISCFSIDIILLKRSVEKGKLNIVTKSTLQKIAEGDKTAVQTCLDQYGGLVWSLARRMLSNKDDAEDAVQEIFVEIWKNAARFDASKSSETTFIAVIARRRLIDRLRKIDRQPITDSFEDMVTEPIGKDGKEIHLSIEAKKVAKVVNKLNPNQRKVLHLSIIEGFTHSEISRALDMPLGTVKTHARRGLIEVRNAFADESKNLKREVSA